MPTLNEIIQCLEAVAPPRYQESYDNSGLILGDPSKMVHKALLCLDCLESVVDEAITMDCDLIVAHHPIVFNGLKSITGKNYVERVLLKAIRENIAIYACHTNLDNVMHGVNAKIAEKIGLTNLRPLLPRRSTVKQLYCYVPTPNVEEVLQALYTAGAGAVGNYTECSFRIAGMGTYKPGEGATPYLGNINELHREEEIKVEVVYPLHIEKSMLKALHAVHPYEEIAYGTLDISMADQSLGSGLVGELTKATQEVEFLQHLKLTMQTACIRHTALLGKPLSTIAVCGGAGSFLIGDALKAGADAFVTADMKYHEFFDAEHRLLIADIGHYESEQYTYEIFSELLLKNFPTFAVLKTSVNTNPVNYYF